jgi:ATP-binding cassette, subfamily F, member 3
MLKLESLSLARGVKTLLKNASVQLNPRECAALVGRNGTGKSSLLAAICNEMSLDSGSLQKPPLEKIVKLEQVLPASLASCADYVLAGDRQLAAAQLAVDAAQGDDQGEQLADALTALNELEPWSAPSRARSLLNGLGFSSEQCEQPVNDLSGGWRMRLNLARVLMAPGDLLLLDEPTNHLDLDAIIWLQNWIKKFSGAVLLVSHDREFIDAVADSVWHLENETITRYSGGYTKYEDQAAARAEQVERQIQTQDERIAHLTSFVERFRAKATKAKQAQSRLKALERIERVQRVSGAPSTRFTFAMQGEGPDPIVVTEALHCGYGFPLLKNIRIALRKGERVGVLGRNGAGKSTLIKTLVGEIPVLSGSITRSKIANIGYFAQGAIEALDDSASALDHMRRLVTAQENARGAGPGSARISPQELRDYLAPWGFRGDLATDRIAPFSGGEKSRLALAMLAWHKPHILILDEPTNHLDAQAREALTLALADYEGALLLVSHDRALLRSTVDRFLLISDGKVEEYDGDLDEYTQWLALKANSTSANNSPNEKATASKPISNSVNSPTDDTKSKEERKVAAQERQRLAEQKKPIEKKLKTIELDMHKAQTRLHELDELLADSSLYDDKEKATAISREHGDISGVLRDLEWQWLELSEKLEALN